MAVFNLAKTIEDARSWIAAHRVFELDASSVSVIMLTGYLRKRRRTEVLDIPRDIYLALEPELLWVHHAGAKGVLPADELLMLRPAAVPDSSYRGPARAGIEAQNGLNDTFPGDPYP